MDKKQTRVEATEELVKLATDYRAAHDNAKSWAEIASEAKERIFEVMEELDGLVALTASGVEVVKVTEIESMRFDLNAFKRDNPDFDLSPWYRPSYSRRLGVKNV